MQLGLKLALVPGLPVRWLLVVLLPQTYEIDADAAEKPADQYSTLQEFFTRRLKPGLRPIAAEG
jgi:phosphatidylserine decarboxylase